METSVSMLERLAATPTDDDWRRLLDLYQPLLRTWVARAGVPASDVYDLVQDVLLVVVRKISGFERRGKGAFRTWLRTILANKLGDYFRRQEHLPTAIGGSDFQGVLEGLKSPDSALSRQWDREHDEHVFAEPIKRIQGQGDFTAVIWEAFRRHVKKGEPAVEVAKALDMSLNSVLLAKSRVLKRLRQELAGLID
jgi:RNA polymerase sigma-70 factor (ECF subfamily)